MIRKIFFIAFIPLLAACKKEKTEEAFDKDRMLQAVNALRSQGCHCGAILMPPVNALVWNDTLATAASAHAADMIAHRYFSHISPSGASPIQRALLLGYSGNYVSENIARGFTTLNDVMNAWTDSEDHCKAMMDSLQTEMGAARQNDYWVQEFGSRR